MRTAIRTRDDKVASLLEELTRAEERVGGAVYTLLSCVVGGGGESGDLLAGLMAVCIDSFMSLQTTCLQAEEMRADVEQSKADLSELEELRELRADVERKERQQAAIIEGQVRHGGRGCRGGSRC